VDPVYGDTGPTLPSTSNDRAVPTNFYRRVAFWAATHWNRKSNGSRPTIVSETGSTRYGPLFPELDGGQDCSNFVSHAWNLGGGLSRDNGSRFNPNDGWDIGFNVVNQRGATNAWANVESFFGYWVFGKRRASARLLCGGLSCRGRRNIAQSVGDVVQYDFGQSRTTRWSHASVVTGLSGVDSIHQWSIDRDGTVWNRFTAAPISERRRQFARILHLVR
jgi:hypothetical protein